MKIALAQTIPVRGDITRNISNHHKLITLAISLGAEMIIFPELSLTGYEPELAGELAVEKGDKRLEGFQQISDHQGLTIGLGIPIQNKKGISISMAVFQPGRPRQFYSKKYLHADEEPFFVSMDSGEGFIGDRKEIALAICYELSVPEHAQYAFENGAEFYIASAVKTVKGVENAISRLEQIAREYGMTVMLSNCAGISGGETCGGRSSVWNRAGLLLGQLNDQDEGVICFDTQSEKIEVKTLLADG